MVTSRVRVVSREVSPARVLPPLFVKTQTGAVVTKVTREIHGARRVVTLNPSLPPAPTSVGSPCAVPRHVPARSGLPFATPPRVRAVDLHARAASSQRFETPPKVARPPPLTSAQMERGPSTLESLPTLLAARAIGQDAPVLASKEQQESRLTDAMLPEQTEVQEAILEATRRTHAQTLQEQQEQYESMLEERKEVLKATLEAALREHAQTLQEQRELYEGMLEERKEAQQTTLEAAMRAHSQTLQEQREKYESLLEAERRRAEEAEANLAMAENVKEEEQRETCARMLQEQKEIQEATQEAAMQAHEQTLQEQRVQYESMLEVERGRAELEHGRRQQAEAKLAMALELKEEALAIVMTISDAHEQKLEEMQAEIRKLHAEQEKAERRRAEEAEAILAMAENAKEEEQRETCAQMLQEHKEIQEATQEAAMQAHEQTLQEQRVQYESMLEVERGRAELEHGRRQQAEAKLAMALELKEEAMKTMSEAHEQRLEEMQAEIRKLHAEQEKSSVFSISDSELAAEAETASSSTRQIAQLPPASAQTHTAGEMPRSDYRAITCYGPKAAQLRAGRRAAEDGTSEQEQAERVQEVRTLYRAKHGPHSTPNATQLVEFARAVGKPINFSWAREEAPKP